MFVAKIQWFDNLNQITLAVLLYGIFAYLVISRHKNFTLWASTRSEGLRL